MSGALEVPGARGDGAGTAASSANSAALIISHGDDLQYMDSESSESDEELDFESMFTPSFPLFPSNSLLSHAVD